MCFGSSPKTPTPPPKAEIQIDTAGAQGSEDERRRRAAAKGYGSTFMSATSGVLAPANIGKTQLGA
jgi:hypothetical protein